MSNPATWTVDTDWAYNGRRITPGTELAIVGEPGRFRFLRHVRTPAGAEWIDVVGGPKNYETTRSFRPDRVKTVHRVTRTRANQQREETHRCGM